MNKINKEIAIFIVFLILVTLWGLYIKTPVGTKTPVSKPQVGDLLIEFEDGTTELEVKNIIENCNMTRSYIIDYNIDLMTRYYIIVDKDKRKDIRNELRKEENWTDYALPDIKKGNYYIITVTEQAIEDKSFLEIMEKNNLQVKRSVVCYIRFGDGSMNWTEPNNWIPEKDAIRIKNKLLKNEKVLNVSIGYIERKSEK